MIKVFVKPYSKYKSFELALNIREYNQNIDQWSAYKFEDYEWLVELIDGKVKLYLGNQIRENNNYTFKDVKVSKGDFLCLYFAGENEIELELI